MQTPRWYILGGLYYDNLEFANFLTNISSPYNSFLGGDFKVKAQHQILL